MKNMRKIATEIMFHLNRFLLKNIEIYATRKFLRNYTEMKRYGIYM